MTEDEQIVARIKKAVADFNAAVEEAVAANIFVGFHQERWRNNPINGSWHSNYPLELNQITKVTTF